MYWLSSAILCPSWGGGGGNGLSSDLQGPFPCPRHANPAKILTLWIIGGMRLALSGKAAVPSVEHASDIIIGVSKLLPIMG